MFLYSSSVGRLQAMEFIENYKIILPYILI